MDDGIELKDILAVRNGGSGSRRTVQKEKEQLSLSLSQLSERWSLCKLDGANGFLKSSLSLCPPSLPPHKRRRTQKHPPFRHNIMLVGNAFHQSPLTLNPTDLSDFVNMDLFTTPSSTTSDSRDPSPSVSTPLFSPLPTISEPNPSDWFNFSFEEDFVKTDQSIPPPVTGIPWDFLTLSNDSPNDSGSANTGSSLSFAIDPQLMSSTVSPEGACDLGEVEDITKKESEEEDEDEESPTSPTIKVGGKGKSRKGTVQSGGIQKKATISAVVRDKDDPRDDGDDWRPSPEEYKKMSSKEKRQLRNKISARNFRVRRKGEIIRFRVTTVTNNHAQST